MFLNNFNNISELTRLIEKMYVVTLSCPRLIFFAHAILMTYINVSLADNLSAIIKCLIKVGKDTNERSSAVKGQLAKPVSFVPWSGTDVEWIEKITSGSDPVRSVTIFVYIMEIHYVSLAITFLSSLVHNTVVK